MAREPILWPQLSKTWAFRIESVMLQAHLLWRPTRQQKASPLNHSSLEQAAPQSAASNAAVRIGSLSRKILDSLDDAKAEDVLTIDLEGKTSIADSMVIATGRSNTHVNAIADRVLKACKDTGFATRVEGLPQCDWVLIDAGDMVVHIFRPEVRQFYNLEKMWSVDRPDERRAG
jgi:ribosome-associated protein